jgi:hypothetical protein
MYSVWYNGSAIWFLAISQVVKILNGFVFANFQLDNTMKITIVLLTQLTLLATVISIQKHFRLKSIFILLTTSYTLKILIHICLLLRAWLESSSIALGQKENEALDAIEMALVVAAFVVTLLEVLTGLVAEPPEPAGCKRVRVPVASTLRGQKIKKNITKKYGNRK